MYLDLQGKAFSSRQIINTPFRRPPFVPKQHRRFAHEDPSVDQKRHNSNRSTNWKNHVFTERSEKRITAEKKPNPHGLKDNSIPPFKFEQLLYKNINGDKIKKKFNWKTKTEIREDVKDQIRFTMGDKSTDFSLKPGDKDRLTKTPVNKRGDFVDTKMCRNSFDSFDPFASKEPVTKNSKKSKKNDKIELLKKPSKQENYKELYEVLQKDYHLVMEENKKLKKKLRMGLLEIHSEFVDNKRRDAKASLTKNKGNKAVFELTKLIEKLRKEKKQILKGWLNRPSTLL